MPTNRRDVLKGLSSLSIAGTTISFSSIVVRASSPDIQSGEARTLEYSIEVSPESNDPGLISCQSHRDYNFMDERAKDRLVFSTFHNEKISSGDDRLVILSSQQPVIDQSPVDIHIKNATIESTPGGSSRILRNHEIQDQISVESADDSAIMNLGEEGFEAAEGETVEHETSVGISGEQHPESMEAKLTFSNYGVVEVISHPRHLLLPFTEETERIAEHIANEGVNRIRNNDSGPEVVLHEEYNVLGVALPGGGD